MPNWIFHKEKTIFILINTVFSNISLKAGRKLEPGTEVKQFRQRMITQHPFQVKNLRIFLLKISAKAYEKVIFTLQIYDSHLT